MEFDDYGPVINRPSNKIATLERRMGWLQNQLRERHGNAASLRFAKEENEALESAVVALKHYRAEVDALETPMTALQELIKVLDDDECTDAEYDAAMTRAQEVVKEWSK